MTCPRCGANNREGARYCDSCGAPLTSETWTTPEPEGVDAVIDDGASSGKLLDQGGLVGWMAFDWTARFVVVSVLGFVLGFVMIGIGEYGASVFFFLLCAVGIVGTWFMIRADA